MRMHAVALALGLMAGVAAAAPAIDLDTEREALGYLADAAGVCAAKRESVARKWACRDDARGAKRFVKRYRGLQATATPGHAEIVRLAVPVAEYGKGYLFALHPPDAHCDASGKLCVIERTTPVYVVAPGVDARHVADATFTFEIDGIWDGNSYWSPRPRAIHAALWDKAGKLLGEGTVLAKTRSSVASRSLR